MEESLMDLINQLPAQIAAGAILVVLVIVAIAYKKRFGKKPAMPLSSTDSLIVEDDGSGDSGDDILGDLVILNDGEVTVRDPRDKEPDPADQTLIIMDKKKIEITDPDEEDGTPMLSTVQNFDSPLIADKETTARRVDHCFLFHVDNEPDQQAVLKALAAREGGEGVKLVLGGLTKIKIGSWPGSQAVLNKLVQRGIKAFISKRPSSPNFSDTSKYSFKMFTAQDKATGSKYAMVSCFVKGA